MSEIRAANGKNPGWLTRACAQVKIGAGNQIRTGDPNLGKVVLYQLSYSRVLQPLIL